MNLVTHVVGTLATNAFVLVPEGASECIVIDPGSEGAKMADSIRQAGLTVRYILSTHGHADHTGGVSALQANLGGRYGVHKDDIPLVESPGLWITSMIPDFQQPPAVDVVLNGGEDIEFGGSSLLVLHTPGHTPGSLCFLFQDVVFTGDTLFRESIGRHDLPGGDFDQELASIRNKLLTLDEKVQVRPGHGPFTTIGYEKRFNPFLL